MEAIVYNLISGEQTIYKGISKEEALISDHMVRNKMTRQLTNPEAREKVRAKIERCGPNGRTLLIGDFGVTTLKKS